MLAPHLAERIVADFMARALPELTPRRITLPCVPGKVDVVTGMRRAGKSWLLYAKMHALEASGVPRRQMLYVDFEDERLAMADVADLQQFPDALLRRHPDMHGERWFFLDEVQNVVGWERFVRRIAAEPNHRVVVTGSSASMLSREIATSMRGRSLTTELMPFGFDESLRHHGIGLPARWPPDAGTRARLQAHLGRYLEIGGFPEVQQLDQPLRIRVLQEYLDVALFRDVVERNEVSNVPALRWLVRRLVGNPAARFSVHRFYNDLRSQGLKASKDTLYAYLDHLEDAYLVGTVAIATDSERVRRSNPRKAYVADHALMRAVRYRHNDNVGHVLENIVYVELRRRGFELSYVMVGKGQEVDFLARRAGGPSLLVQVCADMQAAATRRRELGALALALREHEVDGAVVVTLHHEEEQAQVGDVTVPLIPAWRWLLQELVPAPP